VVKSTIDKKTAEPFVKRLESLEERKDDFKANCKEECDEVSEDQASVYEEAKANGVDPKGLKLYVRRRKLERKINKLDDDVTPEVQAAYIGLVDALGSLIALDGKKKKASGDGSEARPHH
jgi:uncharacterized protein (UPF0335 family)